MAFNLPPGVTESMIPGNRPEYLRRERLLEELAAFIPAEHWNDQRANMLADYIEARSPEAFTGYEVPNSKMATYVTWDGQMVDIAAPVNVEVEVRGDQKVLWVNVDGTARLRVCRIQGELTLRSQTDGRRG
jgi:hypothetical protein